MYSLKLNNGKKEFLGALKKHPNITSFFFLRWWFHIPEFQIPIPMPPFPNAGITDMHYHTQLIFDVQTVVLYDFKL